MKEKFEILREILSLARNELNENGNIGYTMPDGKHHIYIYVDDSITHVDGSKSVEDGYYVIEPNKVVEGVMEPIGDTTTAEYNDFAELLLGCEWCFEQFERDIEHEKNVVLLVSNGELSHVSKTRDYETLKKQLTIDELKAVDNILDAYYHDRIDLDIPRDKNGNFNFEDITLVICDFTYKETGFEKLVLKWIEDFEDTGYLLESIKDSDLKTYNFSVGFLRNGEEVSFETSIVLSEKPDVQWLADQIYKKFSSEYAGEDYIKAVNSIYCIELQIEKNGEYVDQDELCGEELLPVLNKVMQPSVSDIVHKGDSILFDGSFKYWSNACGDLHRNGNEFISEVELPEPLKRAYNELWGEGYSSLCYLVETPEGFGVALVNEYDDYTASVKECSKEDLFELVKADKERVLASPGFENAKVYAGDYTGFEDCHELIVVFPADTPFKEFDCAARALEHIAYNSYFEKTPVSSLAEQIEAAETKVVNGSKIENSELERG